jgi:hypothetical protein
LFLRKQSLKVSYDNLLIGRAPVDEYVYHSELYHVLEDAGVVFDSMMNQTNIVGGSNNNKFYVVQVLETDADPSKID